MKKIFKGFMLLLVVLFLSLYFGRYNTNYYENRKVLTDEAIKRFEKDLKAGKKIDVDNYLPKEKNYNNKASSLGLKTSNLIDKTFSKTLRIVAKYLTKLEKN